MLVTYASRTVERVNLLLVSVLLNALLGIVHDSYNILHLLIQTCKDVCLVVNLEDVTTDGSVYIEVAESIVIERQNLSIQSAVVEALLLILSSQLTRCGQGDEIFEVHEGHVSTNGTLQLQVVSDVPDSLTSQTENILRRVVLILIEVPIGVLVVLVITSPCCIFTLGILINLQPLLIKGAGQ